MVAGAATMGLNLGYSGSVAITVKDANVDNVALMLEPGIEIEGRIRVEDDSALEGRPAVAFAPVEGGAAGPPMPVTPNGAFLTKPLAAGSYRLNIMALPAGSYVKSVAYGTQDATRSPLAITAGAAKLEIVVSLKGGAVTGTLRNEKGEPLSRVMVTAWPKKPNEGREDLGVRTSASDQSGAFKIQGLAPGEYFMAAWEEVDGAVAKDLEFLSAFTSDAVTVELQEGLAVNADLKIVAKDKIAVEANRPR
jgi:hypothetical protein